MNIDLEVGRMYVAALGTDSMEIVDLHGSRRSPDCPMMVSGCTHRICDCRRPDRGIVPDGNDSVAGVVIGGDRAQPF